MNDVRLDTPPDSDSENSDYLNQILDEGLHPEQNSPATSGPINPIKIKIEEDLEAPVAAAGYDLLGFDKLSQRLNRPLPSKTTTYVLPSLKRQSSQNIDSLLSDLNSSRVNSTNAASRCVVQSAESLARVGQLPIETMAVLNKLPSKIFLSNGKGSDRDSPRVIDVVKVIFRLNFTYSGGSKTELVRYSNIQNLFGRIMFQLSNAIPNSNNPTIPNPNIWRPS